MKEHDYSLSYRKLHDKDPIDYHARLSRLGIKCGFCEEKEIPKNE